MASRGITCFIQCTVDLLRDTHSSGRSGMSVCGVYLCPSRPDVGMVDWGQPLNFQLDEPDLCLHTLQHVSGR